MSVPIATQENTQRQEQHNALTNALPEPTQRQDHQAALLVQSATTLELPEWALALNVLQATTLTLLERLHVHNAPSDSILMRDRAHALLVLLAPTHKTKEQPHAPHVPQDSIPPLVKALVKLVQQVHTQTLELVHAQTVTTDKSQHQVQAHVLLVL